MILISEFAHSASLPSIYVSITGFNTVHLIFSCELFIHDEVLEKLKKSTSVNNCQTRILHAISYDYELSHIVMFKSFENRTIEGNYIILNVGI